MLRRSRRAGVKQNSMTQQEERNAGRGQICTHTKSNPVTLLTPPCYTVPNDREASPPACTAARLGDIPCKRNAQRNGQMGHGGWSPPARDGASAGGLGRQKAPRLGSTIQPADQRNAARQFSLSRSGPAKQCNRYSPPHHTPATWCSNTGQALRWPALPPTPPAPRPPPNPPPSPSPRPPPLLPAPRRHPARSGPQQGQAYTQPAGIHSALHMMCMRRRLQGTTRLVLPKPPSEHTQCAPACIASPRAHLCLLALLLPLPLPLQLPDAVIQLIRLNQLQNHASDTVGKPLRLPQQARQRSVGPRGVQACAPSLHAMPVQCSAGQGAAAGRKEGQLVWL